jgi:hypothetical protein
MATMASERAEHGFFGPGGALYGISAGRPDATRAVCLLGPLGEDAFGARRALAGLVRRLALAGLGALLVDVRGTGEAAGELDQTTLGTLEEDACASVFELCRRFGEAAPLLCAFRYAAVPALTAPLEDEVERLALVDPCLDVAAAVASTLAVPGQLQQDALAAPLARTLAQAPVGASLVRWGRRCTVIASSLGRSDALYGREDGVVVRALSLERSLLAWAAA